MTWIVLGLLGIAFLSLVGYAIYVRRVEQKWEQYYRDSFMRERS